MVALTATAMGGPLWYRGHQRRQRAGASAGLKVTLTVTIAIEACTLTTGSESCATPANHTGASSMQGFKRYHNEQGTWRL